ncbi:ABC-type transport auxiliary lipoprotein family protein [Parerythrobacter aurantius]|uniref:ABC-type transport auxiliary lipoprotein family protein n=1 Tax=Parerythrobacter aurantius TaxID=3127706 RepID=UPI00324D1E93
MMRPFLVPLAALCLTGCISLGKEPPPALLTLTPATVIPAGSGTSGSNQSALTVVEPDAPAALSVTRVPVQVDASTVAYLKDAQWVERPSRLFRRLLSETIAAKSGRVVVDGLDPTIKTGQRLRGRLLDFGYDATTSSAVVRFEAIRDGADGSVVTRRFESIVPGVAAEAVPVGDALNRAANDVATQVADWIGG